SALESATDNLAKYLESHREANLADVAYTLQVGRRRFDHRRAIVCRDAAEAIAALTTRDPVRASTFYQETEPLPVVFMFPGQGSQYVGMARGLYESVETFREQIDLCSATLNPLIGVDLRELLYPDTDQAGDASERLLQTSIAQPALFAVEYAL